MTLRITDEAYDRILDLKTGSRYRIITYNNDNELAFTITASVGKVMDTDTIIYDRGVDIIMDCATFQTLINSTLTIDTDTGKFRIFTYEPGT